MKDGAQDRTGDVRLPKSGAADEGRGVCVRACVRLCVCRGQVGGRFEGNEMKNK